MLMAEPATLTQLGEAMGNSPAWVRHHVKILEAAGLIEVHERKQTKRVIEIYYKAKSSAFILQELILPKTTKPFIVFSGSHDTAVEHIAEKLARHVSVFNLPVGSLDGLINLRQGVCNIAGSHLLDKGGEYNAPFVRHLLPDRLVSMITMAYRTQGLILAAGNPKGISGLSDLIRPNITFLNRNPGSGTRLWFDNELSRLSIPNTAIKGYEKFVITHHDSARAVASGSVDVTIGIQSAAREMNLFFIPLFEERYDLVVPDDELQKVSPMLDYLQTSSFRRKLDALTGYNTRHSGEQIAV